MVKKVLALAFGLLLAAGASAQWGAVNTTVPQSNIQYWTGTGSNRAVVAITWVSGTNNIGIAWGVQWNGTATQLANLMDTIAAYDSRLTITWNSSHSYIYNLAFADADLNLNLVAPTDPDYGYAFWFYNWKDGVTDTINASVGITGDMIANGDFVDWITMDLDDYTSQPADTMIMANDPNASEMPEEATIAASDILYWVGNGSNQVVLAVNWADTALAWGYRFATDSVSVQDVMDGIAAADPRFSYTTSYGYLDDILFVAAAGDTLGKVQYSYWESKRNGVSDAGMGQMLGNGDFEKWAEPAAGIVVDSFSYDYEGVTYWYYTYIYPMTIHPVSVPVGISQVSSLDVQVYPNPVANVLNVRLDALNGATEAAIYDMSGRRVFSHTLAAGTCGMQIPVANMANGVYLLRIGDATVKVNVKH